MGIDRADMAIRLVEERTRKGYSQADFARQLDISREGLRRYEMGQREIGTEFLAKAASLGVDVQYVLTGIRSNNVAEAERAAQPAAVTHVGSGNVYNFRNVNGGSIHVGDHVVTTKKHVRAVKAQPTSSEQHITQVQADTLAELVHVIADLEAKVKRKPSSYRAVWGALNAHCGVTRYLQIAAEDYPEAEKYLRQWITRLNAASLAPPPDNDAWRKRKYAYIKINTNDDELWLASYLKKTFKVDSLDDLSDDELDRTYRAVSGRKRNRAQ